MPSIPIVNSLLPQSVSQSDLAVSLSQIELPDTVEYGDKGKVKVTIANQSKTVANVPLLKIDLYLSSDSQIDSNDVLLKTQQLSNVTLQGGKSLQVDLPYDNITSPVAPGAYYLIAKIDAPDSNQSNNTTSKLCSAPGTDAVIDWNGTALNAIQAEGKAGRGVPPTSGSRLLAILSTAVYETVNAFEKDYQPYAIDDLLAPVGASVEAAAAGAAYGTLVKLLPSQIQMFNQQMLSSLAEIKDNPMAEMTGFNFGYSVSQQMLALRNNDGSENNSPYVAPEGDYVWKPETSGPTAGVAVGPNWGKVEPFAPASETAIDDNSELIAKFTRQLDGRPDPDPNLPPEIRAQQIARYAQEIEEVRVLGGLQDTAVTDIQRSDDQTEIAIFWAYDRNNTFRPYGQLNQIAEEIAVQEDNSLLDNARLFAALNTALANAVIVAWDAKYRDVQPRPDDVIAGGYAANDGLEETVADPNWKPLLSTLIGGVSPPFPDNLSGHSSMGGAFAGVMTAFFGENYEFEAVSQELPGVVRHFDSFQQAGLEDALSRVYGGVHVREACEDAFAMGLDVGTYIGNNWFQPLADLS